MLPFSDFDTAVILRDLALILTAGLLALPIGWEREKADRPAGLRTFPVVAVASCAFLLLAVRLYPDAPEAQARILQGLITGIGFIGGGAILQGRHQGGGGHVPGIATAASIWNTGALGAAVAHGLLEIAVVLSATNYLILRFIKPAIDEPDDVDRIRDGASSGPADAPHPPESSSQEHPT